tara:strand:- start:1918 stop:2112 length:195 start_codon:yes stop_codon:yes gene_type:complete
MSKEVRLCSPTERECVLCGRKDAWDSEICNWEIAIENGEKKTGEKFCMHEWDITGTHKSIIEIV